MNRYPGPPSTSAQGQPLSSVGGYPPGMPGHMPSPSTVPPYGVTVASPSQYGQQPVPGPSPGQAHYGHPSPQQPMMGGPGYGQPMMHGIMPPQPVMQQPQPPPQQPPPQPSTGQQPHPAQQQDDFGMKVKRSFVNFDNNLKAFLHEYASVLQMDDTRLNSQAPEALAQTSQNLVRRYEALLVALDLFESNLRMLQDHTTTQSNFRRFMPSAQIVIDSTTHPGHTSTPYVTAIGRPVDQTQYQFLLNKMQTQIDSFNALRDLMKKFLESNSSTNVNNNNNPLTK